MLIRYTSATFSDTLKSYNTNVGQIHCTDTTDTSKAFSYVERNIIPVGATTACADPFEHKVSNRSLNINLVVLVSQTTARYSSNNSTTGHGLPLAASSILPLLLACVFGNVQFTNCLDCSEVATGQLQITGFCFYTASTKAQPHPGANFRYSEVIRQAVTKQLQGNPVVEFLGRHKKGHRSTQRLQRELYTLWDKKVKAWQQLGHIPCVCNSAVVLSKLLDRNNILNCIEVIDSWLRTILSS